MATPAPAQPTIFAQNAASLRQKPQLTSGDSSTAVTSHSGSPSYVERAARTVNNTLQEEARFPALEDYVVQGISGEYEMPSAQTWAPFQRLRQHDLPIKLLEQANQTNVGMQMGIFAPLGHAWAVLDNALYLWDYTLPNPELIGWEENGNPINAVKLVKPKPNVFINEIEHLIVVVTTTEMLLLGVQTQVSPTGATALALYNTRMSISVRGLSVSYIAASSNTGRIFFVATHSDDLYEFRYQHDEGWFQSRCGLVCHTDSTVALIPNRVRAVSQFWSSRQPTKTIDQLVVDDTRQLIYSLGNDSEIKIWTLREDVRIALGRTWKALLSNTGNFSPRSDILMDASVKVVSLSVIPATEASKLAILATTNTGVRLYLSVHRNYGERASTQNPPTNAQITHIRWPPTDPSAPAPNTTSQQGQQARSSTWSSPPSTDISSRLLMGTEFGDRFPPGYFVASLADQGSSSAGRLFCSSPDSARLKNREDSTQMQQRFAEYAMFLKLPGLFHQLAVLSPNVNGASGGAPVGFGNELATQFDEPGTEIAIVTSSAIQLMRRRRLVDIFASIMKYSSSAEGGREGDIKRFVRTYGRGETAATALAVTCGQALDVASDSRLTSITDPEVIEAARQVYIDYGGTPDYNSNAVSDNGGSDLDAVRPSARHEGLALYISRLLRSIWGKRIMTETLVPGQGPRSSPTVPTEKLRRVQRDLTSLSGFLERNKSFIDGLAGTQAPNRNTSRQQEIAWQGEQRAMHGLTKLIASVVEAISFVLVLFDERLDDILVNLSEDNRKRVKELTYEALFVSDSGRELAKELVKSIVNRNIANGSNVDTVAEALRRRCGSFCSADDVVIFKAQEQVKRASEAGGQSESGRVWLNESQRLFQKVAMSLSMEHLQWAVDQYKQMRFYAGAIQLCLVVAEAKDRAKRALAFVKDGQADSDPRKESFDARKRCYDLVFDTIQAVDNEMQQSSELVDGHYTIAAKRRNEAYDIVNGSEDPVFQQCLYDWYVNIGQPDRLLEIDTPYVVDYLKRRSQEERSYADLLWRYFAHQNQYLQAASVQLDLARGFFDLSLDDRIQYLSRARTNASTRQTALLDSRQSKQQLLREISDLLDVANIQDDIYQRMKAESRLSGERREEVLRSLGGQVLPIDELFNQYADQAGYYDICLLIYQVADHRNAADIRASWQNLIDQTNDRAQAEYGRDARAWETVGEKVRELGRRLNVNDATFPVQTLMPMLEKYFMEPKEATPPPTWVPDLFLDLEIPHETLLPVMEQMFYSNEYPFQGSKNKVIGAQMVYLLQSWQNESRRRGERTVFGSEENANMVLDCLASLMRNGLDAAPRRAAEDLVVSTQRLLR